MKNILLIGGTGFLGSAIAGELVRRSVVSGMTINLTLPTRRRERAKHLLVLPTANVVEANVHDPATLTELMRGQDAVISLVGILRGDFLRAHAELPAKIAAAANATGVRRLVHVSALKAAPDAPSDYLRSKAAGEAALRAANLDLTLVRPSVIFGRGDSFLSLFAQLAAIAPFFPLACADARFQPVWVGDVAATVADSLSNTASIGQTYDLGGPRVYALRELVAYAAKQSGHPRVVIGLPHMLAWLQAWAMEFIPNGPMTRDNIRSMQIDSVCDESATSGGFLPFGRQPTSLEAVAPSYL
jgi:uncharacterized protein YbjT (DUF2867 family)